MERNSFLAGFGILLTIIISTNLILLQPFKTAEANDANNKGIIEPVLTSLLGRDIRVPHTDQIVDGEQANLLSFATTSAMGEKSMSGNEITKVSNPHADLNDALVKLSDNARNGIVSTTDADEILNILLGRTTGRIYDGFSLLNFNRWNEPLIDASFFPADAVPGEYKTKTIRDTGETEPNFKGEGKVSIWEIDVNMFWYGQQFDSDTFFIHIPLEVDGKKVSPDDTFRVNYHIYSLIFEDFAPLQAVSDANPSVEFPDKPSVSFPHKAEDLVWVKIGKNSVNHITVQHTAFRFFSWIYTWGWTVHPPRIQFVVPLFEHVNAHTGKTEFIPRSQSMATRNRELDIDGISDVSPEKKIYKIAKSVVDGAVTSKQLISMLNDADVEPKGTYEEWIDLMVDQRQLPPEVVDILESENSSIEDYDAVAVFMNNEMYGAGPFGSGVRDWVQGEKMKTRVFNMDNHTHYYRTVDFSKALHDDMSENAIDGIFSFEIINFKPIYGVPKVAELQWRAGWGFRPGYSVIQQEGTFINDNDIANLKPFAAPKFQMDEQEVYYGYQYSKEARKGDLIFNPPLHVIQDMQKPAFDFLCEFKKDYSRRQLNYITGRWKKFRKRHPDMINDGLVIGQRTEGYGIARMCDNFEGMFCADDFSRFHPLGLKNMDMDGDGTPDELKFPMFLDNPNPDGGHIIPPTKLWEPFLYLSPKNGTIYIDPAKPEKGFWADLTYAHGRPVPPLEDITTEIEMPRSSGQLFYQFDDLFHDNSIFSMHPLSSQR